MSARIRVTHCLIVVIAWAAPAFSQDVGVALAARQFVDPNAGIGIEAAIERAVTQEPGLRATRAEADAARGLRQQADLRPNPTASAEYRGEPGGTDSLTTLGLEWPLDLFRRTGRTQSADRAIEAAQYGVQDRQRLLAAEVRFQYGATVAAVRDLAVADELLDAVRRQFALMRARADTGAAPPLDRDLLEVEVRRLEAGQLLASGRVEAAIAQLKPLLGMASDERLMLRDSLEALAESSLGEPAHGAGRASDRPDVLEAEARVTLSDARIDQARREGRIDMSLFGSYMRMDNGFSQQGIGAEGALERVRGRFNYAAIGASVTVPLRNRNQGQVAASIADKAAAEARREAVALAASADLTAAAVRDRQAQAAFRLYRGGVRDLARRNLDVVRQTFELGRATVFDVIAEQRRYLDIERDYTMAAREVWEARTAWRRARGEVR